MLIEGLTAWAGGGEDALWKEDVPVEELVVI